MDVFGAGETCGDDGEDGVWGPIEVDVAVGVLGLNCGFIKWGGGGGGDG